jgi:alpha-amylase
LATWYRETGEWWTNRYAKDGDGISVEEQERDPGSLLSFYRRLLKLRRERPELASGDARVISTDRPDVLAVLRTTTGSASLLLVNLADKAASVVVPRDSLPVTFSGSPVRDLLSSGSEARSATDIQVDLAPFGIKLLAP